MDFNFFAKSFLASLLLLALCAFQITNSRTLQEQSMTERHEQWMAKHGRVYKDASEKDMRFQIFKENVEFIESMNAGNRPYKLGLNEFTDLSNEEFRANHMGFKTSKFQPKSSQEITPFRYQNVAEVPESIDWREMGAVTGVKDQQACEEAALVCVLLWGIWSARNRAIFEGILSAPLQIISYCTGLLHEFWECNAAMECPRIVPSLRVRWSPPSVGVVKLNFDAACLHNSAAVGFLARDSSNLILGAMAFKIPFCPMVEFVEAYALLFAMRFAALHKFHNVIFEGDSLSLVKKFHTLNSDFSSTGHIISSIKEISFLFEQVQVVYVPRQGNFPAHCLAKYGLQSLVVQEWYSEYPPDVILAVNADSSV